MNSQSIVKSLSNSITRNSNDFQDINVNNPPCRPTPPVPLNAHNITNSTLQRDTNEISMNCQQQTNADSFNVKEVSPMSGSDEFDDTEAEVSSAPGVGVAYLQSSGGHQNDLNVKEEFLFDLDSFIPPTNESSPTGDEADCVEIEQTCSSDTFQNVSSSCAVGMNIQLMRMKKFIELYKRHECLWSLMCKNYYNREARRKSLAAIGRAMGMQEADVQKKINSLRTYYAKEIVKETRAREKGLSGDEVLSRWPHFHALEFLRHIVSPRLINGSHSTSSVVTHNRTKTAPGSTGNSSGFVNTGGQSLLSGSLSSCNESNLSAQPTRNCLVTDTLSSLEQNPLKRNAPTDILTRRNNADQKCQRSDMGALESWSFHCLADPDFGNWDERRSPGHETASQSEQINTSSFEFSTEGNQKETFNENVQSQCNKRGANTNKEQTLHTGAVAFSQKHRCQDRTSPIYDPNDNLTVFGQHIANEIRALKTPYLQSLAKLKIQQVLFSIATDNDLEISSSSPKI